MLVGICCRLSDDRRGVYNFRQFSLINVNGVVPFERCPLALSKVVTVKNSYWCFCFYCNLTTYRRIRSPATGHGHCSGLRPRCTNWPKVPCQAEICFCFLHPHLSSIFYGVGKKVVGQCMFTKSCKHSQRKIPVLNKELVVRCRILSWELVEKNFIGAYAIDPLYSNFPPKYAVSDLVTCLSRVFMECWVSSAGPKISQISSWSHQIPITGVKSDWEKKSDTGTPFTHQLLSKLGYHIQNLSWNGASLHNTQINLLISTSPPPRPIFLTISWNHKFIQTSRYPIIL